jgi:hypothetical protein
MIAQDLQDKADRDAWAKSMVPPSPPPPAVEPAETGVVPSSGPAEASMTMSQALALRRAERATDAINNRAEIDRQVKLATIQLEAKAALELDAAMGQAQIQSQPEAFASSTPRVSGAAQMRARATPVVARELPIVVEEDDDDNVENEAEDTHGKESEPVSSAAAAASTVKALGKRDPHPPPSSFWMDRVEAPAAMGEIAGSEFKFGGNFSF